MSQERAKERAADRSAKRSDVWVQEMLFGAQSERPADDRGGKPTRPRLSYVRVTRDPDAALSYAESRLIAAQVTQGLVTAFARLDPDRRAALRAVFARRPRFGAA